MDRLFLKIIGHTFTLLFFLVPLTMFHQTSEIFEFNKMLVIYLGTTIIASAWMGRMIIHKRLLLVRSPIDIFLMLFLVSQIVATFFSIDPHTSIYGYYGRFNGGLLSIICYIFLYYAFVSNLTAVFVRQLMKLSLITSGITIIWGLPAKFGADLSCLLFTHQLTNSCWTAQFNPAVRMFSTLGQPNWFGAYLVVNFFLALYFFKKVSRGAYGYILLSLYLFFNTSAILFTRSRSALLALFFGLVLFMLYKMRAQGVAVLSQKSNYIHRITLAFIIIVPLFLFQTGIARVDQFINIRPFATQTQKQAAVQRSEIIQEVSSDPSVTDSYAIRRIVWKGGMDLVKENPLFGTGVETFAYAYYFTRPAAHNLTSEWDFIYNKAHNEFINFAATTGFFGLTAYLLMISSFIWLVRKKMIRTDDEALFLCLVLSYSAILVTNFFGFSTTTINLFFYLIPAFVVVQGGSPAVIETVADRPLSARQKKQLLLPLVLFIFGAYFVGSYLLADIQFARGDNAQRLQDYSSAARYFQTALNIRQEHVYQDKLSQSLANLAFLAGYVDQAQSVSKTPAFSTQVHQLRDQSINLSNAALKQSPKNSLYYKSRAKNFFLFYQISQQEVDFDEALQSLLKAQSLAPTDPKIPYTIALFYSTKADGQTQKWSRDQKLEIYQKALPQLNRAIALKPNYRDAYFLKGSLLKKMGPIDSARVAFQYIIDHINKNDSEAQAELDRL